MLRLFGYNSLACNCKEASDPYINIIQYTAAHPRIQALRRTHGGCGLSCASCASSSSQCLLSSFASISAVYYSVVSAKIRDKVFGPNKTKIIIAFNFWDFGLKLHNRTVNSYSTDVCEHINFYSFVLLIT